MTLKHPKETLRRDHFFKNDLQLYVNRATESFNMQLHSHEFIELAYVAVGKGFHYIEDEVQRVHKGQLFVIPLGVSHVFRPTSPETLKDPLIVYNCIFTIELIDSLIPFITDTPIVGFVEGLKKETLTYHSVLDVDTSIEKLFLSLYQEYSLRQKGSSTYLNTLLIQLIVSIYRRENEKLDPRLSKPARFIQVIQYIEQKYAEKITLAHLTDMFQWSERHFQRLFKRHTGQTFNHYLQSLRIQKSCEQLRNSQLHISRIAESVGYRDINSFMTLFKKIVGTTPSGYRQQYK
jgi:AraC-like DNA-binding protein